MIKLFLFNLIYLSFTIKSILAVEISRLKEFPNKFILPNLVKDNSTKCKKEIKSIQENKRLRQFNSFDLYNSGIDMICSNLEVIVEACYNITENCKNVDAVYYSWKYIEISKHLCTDFDGTYCLSQIANQQFKSFDNDDICDDECQFYFWKLLKNKPKERKFLSSIVIIDYDAYISHLYDVCGESVFEDDIDDFHNICNIL